MHQGFTRCPYTITGSTLIVLQTRFMHWRNHVLKRVEATGLHSWVGSIELTIAIGITYFLAARLSLALRTEPDGVEVFWPAAGISSGILIALGRDARLPVAVGGDCGHRYGQSNA
jgi:hypothetical protein